MEALCQLSYSPEARTRYRATVAVDNGLRTTAGDRRGRTHAPTIPPRCRVVTNVSGHLGTTEPGTGKFVTRSSLPGAGVAEEGLSIGHDREPAIPSPASPTNGGMQPPALDVGAVRTIRRGGTHVVGGEPREQDDLLHRPAR